MGANKILFAGTDSEYGRALARAISNLHKEFDITLISRNHPGKINSETKLDYHEFDLILIDESAARLEVDVRKKTRRECAIVILTEHIANSLQKQAENAENHIYHIFKYSCVDDIISDLNFILGITSGKKSLARRSTAPGLIGFYSPGGGTGKSVVALSTGRELSRYHDKRVLYLCFEELPATEVFIRNTSAGRNIGDYLYFLLEKRNGDLCGCPEGFTISDEYGVETFLPSNGRNDLNFLTRSELITFFKAVSESSRYDYIILDLKSDLSDETVFLINLCGKIILIQSGSLQSRFRIRRLLAYFVKLGYSGFLDKTILAVNRSCCSEPSDSEEDCSLMISKKIYIEHDEGSFRAAQNHIEIDINNSFGIGMKKIAAELLAETSKS